MAVTSSRADDRTLDVDVTRFDAVLFDMDGVITDTAELHAAVWRQMFDQFLQHYADRSGEDVRPFDDDDYLRYVDGKHRDDGVESFLRSRGIGLVRGDAGDPPEGESVWALANRKNEAFQHALGFHGVQP